MGLGSKMVLKEKEKKRERKGKREKDGVCWLLRGVGRGREKV